MKNYEKVKTKLILLAVLCVLTLGLKAQNTDYWFRPIHVLGTEFNGTIEGIGAGIKTSSLDDELSSNDQFFLNLNEYAISRFLHSGMVFTSCRATDYINLIADKLLVNNPDLRKNLKFYVVYSSEVNAFTFNNGMIFIHMGLLARLTSEAQLAFVIAHEIQHYKNHHVLKQYKKNTFQDLEEDVSRQETERWQIYNARFSRSQELEADREGLKLYLEAGYSLADAEAVFDVLRKADLQVENKNIPKSFFEGTYFKLPEILYPDSNYALVLKEETFDSLATHPACEERKKLVSGFQNQSGKEEKSFLVSQVDFESLRDASYYFLSAIYIKERDFVASLYNTACLLEKYPNDENLISLKLKALYYLQVYLNEGFYRRILKKPGWIFGNYSKFHNLFKAISNGDMNGLVLRQAWTIAGNHSSDSEMVYFRDAVTRNFRSKILLGLSYFKDTYNDSLVQLSYAFVNIESPKPQKLGAKKTKVSKPTDILAQYSMPDFKHDSVFISVYENAFYDDSRFNSVSAKKANSKKLKGFHTQKMLLLGVTAITLDKERNSILIYDDMNGIDFRLKDLVANMAKRNKMELSVFNPVHLEGKDTLLFLERNLLERWKEERMANSNINPLPPSEHGDLSALAEKYHTPYVAMIENYTVIHDPRSGLDWRLLVYSVVNPLAFANVFYMGRSNKTYFGINFKVFNFETGEMVYQYDGLYNTTGASDYLKAEYYSIFYDISK